MKQEFPKCLIKGDEHCIVMDAEQEKAARADGFTFHADETQEVTAEGPKRRSRKGEA